MRLSIVFCLGICVLFTCVVIRQAAGATLEFASDQMSLHDAALGDFKLEYPALYDGSKPYTLIKPAVTISNKQQVQLAYHWQAQDKQIQATLKSDANGVLKMTFDSIPQGMRSAIIRWLIPYNFAMGGKWAMGDEQPVIFPVTMLEKPKWVARMTTLLRYGMPVKTH